MTIRRLDPSSPAEGGEGSASAAKNLSAVRRIFRPTKLFSWHFYYITFLKESYFQYLFLNLRSFR